MDSAVDEYSLTLPLLDFTLCRKVRGVSHSWSNSDPLLYILAPSISVQSAPTIAHDGGRSLSNETSS